MRAFLDAVFKYLAWALFLLIAVMIEVTWGYSDAVSQSYHTVQTIKLAVILLCGIIIIDILFALIGVYRRGSKKLLEKRVERRTIKRIREEQEAQKAESRPALFFRKKEKLPPSDSESSKPAEYDAPIIVFPPAGDESYAEEERGGEDLSIRGRLRSAISTWLPIGDGENDGYDGEDDEEEDEE